MTDAAQVVHRCSVCGTVHPDEAGAQQCEAKGTRTLESVPVGCIDCADQAWMTPACLYFASVFVATDVSQDGHGLSVITYACCANELFPRRWGRDFSLGLSLFNVGRPAVISARARPAYVRLVKVLGFHGITPTLWDGQKAVVIEMPELGQEGGKQ